MQQCCSGIKAWQRLLTTNLQRLTHSSLMQGKLQEAAAKCAAAGAHEKAVNMFENLQMAPEAAAVREQAAAAAQERQDGSLMAELAALTQV